VEARVYGSCAANAEVRAVVVHGMGHVWPPRSGQTDASGPSSRNLDATAEIVSFFMGLE
jgi:poly(3-hydroxybutyrate) depolymerase